MSEEFSMKVSFTLDSAKKNEDFEAMFEHLEMEEAEEAGALLNKYNLSAAQQQVDALTSPYSDYGDGTDLVDMYTSTYNDNVSDAALTLGAPGSKSNIEVEGHDHDADDFCAALVLILVAMGAADIDAEGGSPHWLARWSTNESGQVQLTFEEEE
jgi:hypothetical protein